MKKILIVEDDLDIQEMIQFFLEDQNYQVCVAEDGVEGVVNIPVRQHRKSGRRETVCPGLRKPLMRVYSRNVLSKP